MSRETLKQFRIGFAPNAKDALRLRCSKQGFTEAQLLEAGLLIKPDDGRPPMIASATGSPSPFSTQVARHRFRRPRARSGRRAEIPQLARDQAVRQGLDRLTISRRARKAAFDKDELIVVEGYMDVIALHQAGFANAVATLGTAFTERQMELLWQLAAEPDRLLRRRRAGRSGGGARHRPHAAQFARRPLFRFAFLPEGSDPDDLVRTKARALSPSVLPAPGR